MTADDRARPSIGFIGLGAMGSPMTANLLKARGASEVWIYARRSTVADPLLALGARSVQSPRELAERTQIVISMLPDLPDLEAILHGSEGFLAGIASPMILVVGSSVDPQELVALAERIRITSRGLVSVVDAPVSGGTAGAEAGTLAIMVGGTENDARVVLPLLAAMGTPVHLGPLGAGQVAKACNQMIVAATMSALAEASVIIERSGLDLGATLVLLGRGLAGSRVLEDKQQRLVDRDYSPAGRLKFMNKDLSAATSAAVATDTETPQLNALRSIYGSAATSGLGELDLAAVHRLVHESRRCQM